MQEKRQEPIYEIVKTKIHVAKQLSQKRQVTRDKIRGMARWKVGQGGQLRL